MQTVARSVLVVAAASSLAIFAQACTLASPTHITEVPASADADSNGDDGAPAKTASTTPASGAASSCSGAQLTKVDTSTLTACGNGKGHCYGTSKVPGGSSIFGADSCSSGQVCVGDEFLEAGGSKLASCTNSLLGKPGACANINLMPQALAQGGSALKQDGCDAGLVCMPCTNPLDGTDTGLCGAVGVSATDCASTSTATTGTTTTTAAVGCCTTNGVSNGQCIPSSAIPSDSQSMASQDTCSAGNSCVPKALVAGAPTFCDGGFKAFGGKSICLDTCFASGIEGDLENVFLDQDKCGATELCVPCNMIKLGAGSTPVPGCN